MLPMPDDDDLADKYVVADEAFTAAGLGWYEVSNWASGPDTRCGHNRLYWTGADWWGVGPGAHSHVGGVRWWNVKHPSAYAARIAAGSSPAHAREVLDDETRRVERVLLELRLADGLPLDVLDDRARADARWRPGWPRWSVTGSCSRRGGACSPTQWSATCCPD